MAASGAGDRSLGLPTAVRACLFDLDGVLTKTATVHAAAWKEMFDEFLRRRAEASDSELVPFDADDYADYVDGKPREDGVRSFLAARGIELPAGGPDDPPDAETVAGLGERKNEIFMHKVHEDGVEAYPGSRRYLDAVAAAGLRCAVVSSSSNCEEILASAGLAGRFDARIDGVVAAREDLSGKPAPDTYLAGARALGVAAADAAVFEDALAGVEAGCAGGFGCVVGVDRVGHGAALAEHGATVVVEDLAELLDGR